MKESFPLQVSVDLHLRPTRIAFVVRPGDMAGLLSIFQLNTIVWGGIYNFIIPAFKALPRGLKDSFGPKRSANDIRQAYLESIEPDYLVGTGSDNRLFDYPSERKRSFVEINDTTSSCPKLVQGVGPVYGSLYDKWFRHSLREPLRTFLPRDIRNGNDLFLSACFGSFAADSKSSTLRREYERIFVPDSVLVSASNLLQCIFGNHPLSLGAAHLRCSAVRLRGAEGTDTLYLMAMDSGSWMDLVDYWNLRAFGLDICPAPLDWNSDINSFFPEEDAERALGANVEIFPSRTLDKTRFSAFLNSFPKQMGGSHVRIQASIPQIWSSEFALFPRTKRGKIVSESVSRQITSQSGELRFELLSPNFSEVQMEPDCWVNEVSLSFHTRSIEQSQFLPRGIQKLGRTILAVGGAMECWSDQCGVITAIRRYSDSAYWSVPTTERIFKSWFSERGFDFEVSSAGKLAREMIRWMGGRASAYPLNYEAITDFLCRLSRPADGGPTSTVHRNALVGIIKKGLGGVPKTADYSQKTRKADEAQGVLNALVNKKILKVGLQLACPTCSRRNWYPVEKIENDLECAHCLQAFSFPASDPPKDAWHYKTVGPFSIPGAADGSYSVMLAIHFLSHFYVTRDAAVLPGFELWPVASATEKREVDFAGFFRSHGLREEPSELVFGECKSWNTLTSNDVRKMRSLSKAFPGSVITFCTFKDKLANAEVQMLSSFALAGRQPSERRRWSTPVVILTARELFSVDGPPRCWSDTMPSRNFSRQNAMEGIADITQQLYLGLPAYSRFTYGYEDGFGWHPNVKRKVKRS